MGLTLNSSTLTLNSAGGDASGLTQAQVEAFTDYTHLGTLEADNSSELSFTGFKSGYNTLKLIIDGVHLTSAYFRIQVTLSDGATPTYSYALDPQSTTASNLYGATATTFWEITRNYTIVGETTGQVLISNAKAGKPAMITSFIGARSNNVPLRFNMGGNLTTTYTGEIVGIRLYPSGNTFLHGKVYLYGLNENG